MEDATFDDLTRRLAAPIDRRQALKLAVGTLAGGLVASLGGMRKAAAAPDPCAVFCGKTAFTSGPAHASCLQACKKCGGDVANVCSGPTGSVCCASGTSCCPGPTGTTCCAGGLVCGGTGQCVKPRSFCIPLCPSGDTCSGTTTGCVLPCAGATSGCACVSTVEGSACIQEVCTGIVCTSSADCGPGAVCFTQGCCGP
jgi:hypothetical protein